MFFLTIIQSADSDPSAQPPIDKSGYVWYNEYILLRKAVLSVKKSSASIIRLLCILLPLVLLLSGCDLGPKPNCIASYGRDNAPLQILSVGNRWVALVGELASDDYFVSVSDSSQTLNNVYSVQDVSIWFFTADEDCVVWCEATDTVYTYKAYLFDQAKVETIASIQAGDNYQPMNVGIYDQNVYYTSIDYSKQTVTVNAYNIDTKITAAVLSEPLVEGGAPYPISVEGNYLSYAGADSVKVIDLNNGESVWDVSLPKEVEFVYAISYDVANDACGLYYCDEDSEDLGILQKGATEVKSHFTFHENHYAYHDQIRCTNGHLYWITQANVTGQTTDHYVFVDYNYLNPKAKNIERTFYFSLNGDTIFTLQFNQDGNYELINLNQH